MDNVAQRTKICLVIPSLLAGGMERVISELANYISRDADIEVHLVVLTKTDIFYDISNGVIIHRPTYVFNKKNRIYNQVRTLLFLRQILRKINPVSILSYGETYNSFVLLATLFTNLKVYVSDRSKPDKRWGAFHEVLRRIIYPKAFGIISQTSYSKKFLFKETGHKNIRIIPNPVPCINFPVLERDKIILNVGRIISTKMIDMLLDMFSEINNGQWTLWIVGDGPLRAELELKAENMGISKNVKFWGSQKDIAWFYSKASIFAFTSISEGFPNALLESMAAGLPAVAFDCIAGPSDLIINGETGFLLQEYDVLAYKEKLRLLIENEKLRLDFGEHAKISSEKYSIEKIGEEYKRLLCQ